MKNSSMVSEAPSILPEDALDKLNEFLAKNAYPPVDADDLTYCSWPQVFSSSSGPFRGIGCQAMTTFRMEAWVWEQWAVVFSCGKIVKVGELRIHARY